MAWPTTPPLAAATRAGRFDDDPGLIQALRARTCDRLLVAPAGWLRAERGR
jgi:hypothetical protein